MHILKLALPLAGLLVAAQALARKASQASAGILGTARAPASRIDTDPASLLGEASGRSIHGTSAPGRLKPAPAPAITNAISARINLRH